MNDADKEPTPASLDEIPETDFSHAIRPNRYAALRGEFRHAVFVDPALWSHFGSEERVRRAPHHCPSSFWLSSGVNTSPLSM